MLGESMYNLDSNLTLTGIDGMLNKPLYDLGDTLAFTGIDLIESEGNLTYYYSEEDLEFISERYVYDPFTSNSTYSENYSYSSSDGTTVDYIFSGYRKEEFDAEGRLIYMDIGNSSLFIEFGSETETTSSTTTNYVYANSTGYELDFATEIIASNRNGTPTSISEALFEYSYLEEPSDINDYYQRRTSGTADNNADSVIDFTYYNLETVTDTSYDLVSVSFNSSSQQVGSFSSSYSQGNFGSFEQEEAQAQDNDGDGIINYSTESNSSYVYNSAGILVSLEDQQIVKQDYDDDGVADYYSKTKRTGTESSGKQVQITWESSQSLGFLTIGVSRDFDGDQIYDQSRSFSFRFGAPSFWTAMGGHVAGIDDTLL